MALMKRIAGLLVLSALLVLVPHAARSQPSGGCSILAQAKGKYYPTFYACDSTGFGQARDDCIAAGGGIIQLGPGAESVVTTYPQGAGLIVIKAFTTGFDIEGLKVGGQAINSVLRGSAVLDFDLTSVPYQDLTISLTGAIQGDEVFLGVPAMTGNVIYFAAVTSANVVTVRAMRACDSTPNPASGTFRVTVFH